MCFHNFVKDPVYQMTSTLVGDKLVSVHFT